MFCTVIKVISEKGIGVTFVKENKEVVGIITDGDIRRAYVKGVDFRNSVSSIMKKNRLN